MKDQKRFAALALSAVMVFSMAGSVSVAVCNRPYHRKCSFFVLSEVSHTKDACTVGLCIEIAECLLGRIA